MNCREARAWMPHYLNGELSTSERELLQAHVAECEGCFAEQQSLRATHLQVRRGLHIAAERVEPSAQAWAKLSAAIQSQRPAIKPAPQHRPTFFVRATSAVLAAITLMVGAALLRPGLMGNLTPSSEAPATASLQPTQAQPVRNTAAASAGHKQLVAFLKSEPTQSVQTAIAQLTDREFYGLNDFACRTCLRMQ